MEETTRGGTAESGAVAGTGADRPAGRIVVGVDGSPGADHALRWAATEAAWWGAVLDIRAAYPPGYSLVSREEVDQELRQLLEEAEGRARGLAPGLQVTGSAGEGPPAETLVRASDGADLLVVGSRGRGGFAGLLLGSVSQQCSLHAHCPVVIVRSFGEQAGVREAA